MSRPIIEHVTCPDCGLEGPFTTWSSLNNVLSPQETELLLSGKLFLFDCQSCGTVTHVWYPCLYHDMEKRAMVQMCLEDKIGETIRMLTDFLENSTMGDAGYRFRVVVSENELREKALIFKEGLDDRSIEVCKVAIKQNLAERGSIAGSEDVFFLRAAEDGALAFEIVLANSSVWAEAPRAIYDASSQFIAESCPGENSTMIVNGAWAMALLGINSIHSDNN